MPEEIENYVHRIGRTGRGNAQGYATTFINKSVETGVLLDLKHLLIEVNKAELSQCQICIGYPLTSQSDPKGPGTSKLGWRYFEHYKVDRN